MSYHKKTRPALWTTTPRQASQRALRAAAKPKPSPARSKPIRPVSKARGKMLAVYRKRRLEYLKARPYCFCCKQLSSVIGMMDLKRAGLDEFEIDNARAFRAASRANQPHAATEVHHREGRAGARLIDTTGFVGTCSAAHRFIHDNPVIAKVSGLLGQP